MSVTRVELRRTLQDLSEGVGKRLRNANRAGTTVKLKIRWPDFTTVTRQVTLSRPNNDDKLIYAASAHLFEKVWHYGQAVRLIGVGVSGLKTPIRQLSLWDLADQVNDRKAQNLRTALEVLRQRYGEQIVQRANEISTEKLDGRSKE